MLETIYKINLDGTGAATCGPFQLEQGLVALIAKDAGLTVAEVTQRLEAREWVTTNQAHYCAADRCGNILAATTEPPIEFIPANPADILAALAECYPHDDFEAEALADTTWGNIEDWELADRRMRAYHNGDIPAELL